MKRLLEQAKAAIRANAGRSMFLIVIVVLMFGIWMGLTDPFGREPHLLPR